MKKSPDFVGQSFWILVITLASRILGFLRDLVLAWIVGAGVLADCLAAVLRIPHLFRRLLAEGILSLHLTSAFVLSNSKTYLYCSIKTVFAKLFFGISLLFFLLTPFFLAEHFPESLSVWLILALLAPYLFFVGMTALCISFLHACTQFIVCALVPLLFNITLLSVFGIAFFYPATIVYCVAGAFSLASCLQWYMLRTIVEKRLNPYSRMMLDENPHLRETWFRNAKRLLCEQPLSIFAASSYHLAFFATLVALSYWGEGQVAAFFYAERLFELPLGILGNSIGVVSLPLLGEYAKKKQFFRFRRQLEIAFHYMFLVLFPCVAGLFALSFPIIQDLFGHGNFDAQGVVQTDRILCSLLWAMPACAILRLAIAALFAASKRIFLAVTTGITLALFCLLLSFSVFPTTAVSIALTFQASLLLACLYVFLPKGRISFYFFAVLAFSFVAVVCFAKCTYYLVSISIFSHIPLCALFAAVVAGILIWLLMLAYFLPREISRMLRKIRKH